MDVSKAPAAATALEQLADAIATAFGPGSDNEPRARRDAMTVRAARIGFDQRGLRGLATYWRSFASYKPSSDLGARAAAVAEAIEQLADEASWVDLPLCRYESTLRVPTAALGPPPAQPWTWHLQAWPG